MMVKVSDLQPGDIILRNSQFNVPIYEIQETWPLTDDEFAAKVVYINSFTSVDKYWKNPDVEVLVDRPE